jgi:hypothetical protein
MKKITLIIISLTAVFAVAGLAFGEGITWPPKPVPQQALSCGNNLGAVYPMLEGYAEIYCATKIIDGKPADVKKYICAPEGSTQKCSPGLTVVNRFDIPAAKMQKVCAPSCSTWE